MHGQRAAECCLALALLAAIGIPANAQQTETRDQERRAQLAGQIEELNTDLEAAERELADLEAGEPADGSLAPDPLAADLLAPDPLAPSDPGYFGHLVEPILRRNCWACHGPLRQKSELRLDSRPALLLGGSRGAAIVPGDPESSLLIGAIRREGELEMPPPGALSDAEIGVLTEWIAAGASWPKDQIAGASEARETARAVPVAELEVASGPAIDFNREVRPILSNHCYQCHGPDQGARQAGLRLDSKEHAYAQLVSGKTAITPRDLSLSQLFQRVAASEPQDRMPPPHLGKPLSNGQIQTLGRWIQQGAVWQPHWSFVAPRRATAPAVSNQLWPRNPIDRFVLARLEQEAIEPSTEAKAETLIRRMTLDLTGLPPTPEEIDDFLQDSSPGAIDRVLNRLFESHHYGEHMARYWLDASRYADTNGYHIDNERFMWRWREWVIAAFNRNQPFDRFTIDQLAGDLLPDPTPDQLLATGFHRNHMINFEGGAIPEEYRTQYVFDRVDTTSTVWMGLTVGCAKCHDHKFDPISQREYYQLAAFFNTVAEEGLDGQDGNAAPTVLAPDEQQRRQLAPLDRELEPLEDLLDRPDPSADAQQLEWERRTKQDLDRKWRVLQPTKVRSSGGATPTTLADLSTLVSGANPDQDTFEIWADTDLSGITALRLEALTDPSLPKAGVGRSLENGSFVLTEIELDVNRTANQMASEPQNEDAQTQVRFVHAVADHENRALPVLAVIDGDPSSGWSADYPNQEGKRTAVFVASSPFGEAGGSHLRIRLRHQSSYPQRVIGRFRLSVTSDPTMSFSQRGPWRLNGPFVSNGKAGSQWAKRLPPERRVDLESTYRDGRLRWNQVARPEEELTDTTLAPGISYFHQVLVAPSHRTAKFRLEAPGAFRVWLNGEIVAERSPHPSGPHSGPNHAGENDETASRYGADLGDLELDLRQGENQLLIKALGSPDGALSLSRISETLGSKDLQRHGLERQFLLATSEAQRTPEQRDQVRRIFRRGHWDRWQPEEARYQELTSRRDELVDQIPTTMVMAEMEEPRPTFVLRRGQYDQPGEQVESGTPSALPAIEGEAKMDRLALARWLVRPDHPLTSRVVANRLWQRFFGIGLVKTGEDFGSQGEAPSHPELLDWLATELVQSGWDLQHLQRLIVSSATYRQSSKLRPELNDRDPENRLLARSGRFRLDAEVLRDSALSIAGLLSDRVGGPSVKPYQPAGLWEEIGYESRGRFSAGKFEADSGEDLYRRSLYTFWKRTVPPPNMIVFDAPNRETCVVERSRSNTPLQALTLMNDPQYVEAARALAQRMMRMMQGGATTTERIELGFRLATGRLPATPERTILERLFQQQLEHYEADPRAARALLTVGDSEPDATLDAPELAAWSAVASVILNLDETLTRS